MSASLRPDPGNRWLAVLARFALAGAALALVACDRGSPPAAGPVAQAGDIAVYAPYVPAPAAPDVAALYFTLQNGGDDDDRLVSVHTDVSGMAMLHRSVEREGASAMESVEGGVPVPAQGVVRFQPGGLHVMLMPLARKLEQGGRVQVTLDFERAGTLRFAAPVTSYADEPPPAPPS